MQMFISSACGFVLASIVYSIKRKMGDYVHRHSMVNRIILIDRYREKIAFLFLFIGFFEFLVSYVTHGGLSSVRQVAVIEGTDERFLIMSYIFYASYPILVYFAIIDVEKSAIRWRSLLPLWLGLVFHGLSIGGRINIVVGTLFYILSFVLYQNRIRRVSPNKKRRLYFMVRAFIFIVFASTMFSLFGILRTSDNILELGTDRTTSPIELFLYVSDSLVSTSTHASEAQTYGKLFGKFLFDGPYRILTKFGLVEHIPDDLFGHKHYQGYPPQPYGWCQVNSIPRMIADFGYDYYMFAFFVVSFIAQYISLVSYGRSLFVHTLGVLSMVCSAYSIQASMWFSAYSIIIMAYCIIIQKINLYYIRNLIKI